MLLAAQISPISKGLTAHEMERGAKYRYMQDKYGQWYNRFDIGMINNWALFFQNTNKWNKPDIQQFIRFNMAPIEPIPPELRSQYMQQK